MVMGDVAPDAVTFPGLDVIVKEVAVDPKVATVKATVAVIGSVAVAVPIVGASGIAAEAAPIPILKLLFKLVLSDSLLVATLTTFLRLGYFATE